MLGALKFAAGGSTFTVMKHLAEAVIMSRLTYGIQLWGAGSTKTVINRIQVVQNLAMCWMTGKHKLTSTKELLTKMNWLSVNQLIFYHSFLMMFKVRNKQSPKFNYKQLNYTNNRARIDLTRRRWSKNVQVIYEKVDHGIRNERKISVFKKRIKVWIKKNIGILSDKGY